MKTMSVPRPRRHFAPAKNWMNDPNGMFFDGELYHLYFQYNPHGIDHGNMSWGHATSCNLIDWEQHETAILHDEQADIFSGSIVIDRENSSGFGDGSTAPVIALYTAASRDESNQSQALAYSLDGGYTFAKYCGNPVLDRQSKDFRDPKVFRYASESQSYWVMVAVEAVERRVLFYRSENLIDWQELSSFGPHAASFGIWECPDLFRLPVHGSEVEKWVLLVSLNPGGIAGGSGTQYFIGEFDGSTFTPDEAQPARNTADFNTLISGSWLDYGRDCYAGVTFHGLPAECCTLMAWMSNWDYARQLPHSGWRGSMTTARTLDLVPTPKGLDLRQRFIGLPQQEAPQSLPLGEHRLELSGPAYLELQFGATAEQTVSIELLRADDSIMSTIEVTRCELTHQRRGGIVDHELYASTQRMPFPDDAHEHRISVVVDSGSIEILASDGRRSLTDQLTGESTPARLIIRNQSDELATLSVTELPAGDAK